MLHADPTLSVAERVDAACDRFEAERRSGLQPSVDDYVAAAPESDRDELRPALLAVERELQSRAGLDTSVARSSATADGPPPTVEQTGDVEPMPVAIGRFEIRGTLGAGAFGRVYRAFDPQLGRDVAVKVPLNSAIRTDDERARFLKEARVLATINHPNVCQIHEVGEVDGRPYIVMALVPGKSLADTLKARKEPLPEKQVAQIVRKIALALAAAHGRGIVHRDLKPANVMFDRERKDIIVMDFGLARGPLFGDAGATQSGVIMGTPTYMSPEQARGESKAVGPAGDVFSLGVILYELLTGSRPFSGTATEVIGKILHVEPQPPSQRRPGIDPRLEAACLKAMAKDPAARFATMKEFAAAIDAVLRGAVPAGPATETARASGTLQGGDQSTAATSDLAGLFAALSADRKQTADAVEAAIAKHRTPRWVLMSIGLCVAAGLIALAGIMFFTKTDKVKVTIELTDVDLSDKTLSFFLDEEPISADALAKPVELKPGEHVLVVKRGKTIVKRMLLTVTGGRKPGIRVKDITPPLVVPIPPPSKPDADRAAAEWAKRLKAIVVVDVAGDTKRIVPTDALPNGKFKLIGIYFRGQDIEAAGGLMPLKGLTHLRDLSLWDTKLTDDQLRAIEGMTSLRLLNLHAVPVTNACMSSIATLPNLEELWLHYRPITDAGIARIAGLKKLKHLRIRRTKVGPEGLKFLAGMSALEHLDLGGTGVTDASLAHLAGLVKLKFLTIEGTPLTGSGLKHLARLPQLEKLHVGDDTFAGTGNVTDEGLRSLTELKHLRSLSVGNSTSRRLTGATLKVIGTLTSLEELHISIPACTNDNLAQLKNLSHLVHLVVRCPKVTDDGLTVVAGMQRLSMLYLEGTAITGSGFVHVAKLPRLTDLRAANTLLADAGLEHLTGLRQLTQVHFQNTQLTDRGLERLAKISSLRWISVVDTVVTDAGLRKFQSARPECVLLPQPKDKAK